MQIADWHERYLQQAQWTEPLRRYILSKLPICADWTVCEFGSGTGAVLDDLEGLAEAIVGLDKDLDSLTIQTHTKAFRVNADALEPPFLESSFDLVFCHYFLLWVAGPMAVLQAARKVLKPGAYLAIFAEPDYASRKTQPKTLEALAELQNASLAAQGAHLEIGRELGYLLNSSGFSVLEYGQIKEAKNGNHLLTESEKKVMHSDWEYLLKRNLTAVTQEELEHLLKIEPERWHVPTYYALARLNE